MPHAILERTINVSAKSIAGVLFGFGLLFGTTAHAVDAERGKSVFNQCAGCHAIGEGAEHRFGPQLNGILTRGAGAATGYNYSSALKEKVTTGLNWNVYTLDEYLASPLNNMPGTKMAYPGLQSKDDRTDVIAYLASIDEFGLIAGAIPEIEPESGSSVKPSGKKVLAIDVPTPEHGVLHLGRVAFSEEIKAWDIDVRPDGEGLPKGQGSVEVGGIIYDVICASCHGVFGEGEGRWPVLAGGEDTLTEERPEKTVGSYWPYLSTVYDYIKRAMPFGNTRSLTDDDVYALTAYLLYLNDLVGEDFELSDKNFTDIRLPNESNFMADNRLDENWTEMQSEPCMSNCIQGKARVTQTAQFLNVTPDSEEDSTGVID